jgi:hypothetical protein
MNKDRKMEDGIRIQMVQSYEIELKKAMEKRESRQA